MNENPIVRAILRGGGGSEHDRMKLASWSWLTKNGFEVVDFEIGGFDVIGISKNRNRLGGRIVIDAKASKADLVSHFKKDQVPKCDIDEKFSEYASLHYIIARKGLLPVDSVLDPWGLLEADELKIEVVKEADPRAFIGDDDPDIFRIASRTTALLGTLIARPNSIEKIRKVSSNMLLDEKLAIETIRKLQDDLVRYCTVFETLYGFHPLNDGKVLKNYLRG